MQPPNSDPLTGTTLDGRYTLGSLIGAGGMGAVYRATDTTGAERAVKVLTESALGSLEQRERFRREAQALMSLDDPHIVRVFDCGTDATRDLPYLVMELVDGATLDAQLEQGGLSDDARLTIAKQICAGLARIHAIGLTHRDLTPANVIVARQPNWPHAKILDLGLVKLSESWPARVKLTTAATVFGTPAYMAPEVASGGASVATPRSDVYAMGVILFELLTDAWPFVAESQMEMLKAHLLGPIPTLADARVGVEYDERLQAIIETALAKEPDARYPTAAEMLAALSSIPEGAVRGVERSSSSTLSMRGRHSQTTMMMGLVSPDSLRASGTAPAADTAWPCLVVYGPHSQSQPLLVLDSADDRIEVGRALDCDLVIDDLTVSRRHAEVRWGHDGWWVRDLGSSGGTFLGPSRVTPRLGHPLDDGAVLAIGDARLVYHASHGAHQPMVRSLIIDAQTGILNRLALEVELGRRLRRGPSTDLLLWDIDEAKAYERRVGRWEMLRLVRLCAEHLLALVRQSGGRTSALFRSELDTFVYVACDDTLDTEQLLRAGKDRLCELLRLTAGVDTHGPTASAVRVTVEGSHDCNTSAADALTMAHEKLLQAKLAGGNVVLTQRILPLWFRSGSTEWAEWIEKHEPPTIVVVAHDSARRGAPSPTADSVRRSIALALEQLPGGSRVAVAWPSQSAHFLVATDASEEHTRAALGSIPGVELIVRRASRRRGVLEWVSSIVEGRSKAHQPDSCYALGQLVHVMNTCPQSELWSTAIVCFEAALRFLANALLACFASQLCPRDSRPVGAPTPEIDQALAAIRVAALHPAGLGRWLHLLMALSEAVDAAFMPERAQGARFAKWVRSVLVPALHARNEVHEHTAPSTRTDQGRRLYDLVVQLANTFSMTDWELVLIERTEPLFFHSSRGHQLLHLKKLVLSVGAVATREESNAPVAPGFWLRVRNERWVLLSPLLEFEYCTASGRATVFVAADVPCPGDERVARQAMDQRSTSVGAITPAHGELKQLLERLRSVPDPPGPRSSSAD